MFRLDNVLSLNSLLKGTETHLRLQLSYGDICMVSSSVRRRVKYFEDGYTSIQDEPRSGRPRTASTERNKERVDELIRGDRRVTMNDIAEKLAVQESMQSLGYRNVCARWVPRLLTSDGLQRDFSFTGETVKVLCQSQ